MAGLLKALRVLGLFHLWKLRKAQILGTPIERGFFATRVVQSLFNVGFFDRLSQEGSIDISAFAQQYNLDLRILRLLSDHLCALHSLDREQERYFLGKYGRVLTEVLRGTFGLIYAHEDLLK